MNGNDEENIVWKKLGDLCKIRRGGSPRPIQNFVNKGINPWLKITDINNLKIMSIEQTINDEGASKGLRAVKGDIIYTNSATPGLAINLDLDVAYLNDGFLLFTDVSKEIDKSFLVFYLNSVRDKILKKGAGSIFTNLNKEIVENIEIPIMSSFYQNKISTLLSSIDELIEMNTSLVENLELKKKSSLKKFLSIKSNDKENLSLNDICINLSSSLSMKNVEEKGKFPVYGANSVVGYNNELIIEEDYIALIKDGAGVGRVYHLPKNSYVLGTMMILIPKEGFEPSYLKAVIENINFDNYVSGSTIPHLYFKDIKKIKIGNKINHNLLGNYFDVLGNLLEDTTKLIEELKLKKQYYLNQIFN